MLKEAQMPSGMVDHGAFAELSRRRSRIESDIAHQQVRVIEVLSRLISPRNMVATFSTMALDGMKGGFSLFRWFGRVWQWWSFMRRFVKRFL